MTKNRPMWAVVSISRKKERSVLQDTVSRTKREAMGRFLSPYHQNYWPMAMTEMREGRYALVRVDVVEVTA